MQIKDSVVIVTGASSNSSAGQDLKDRPATDYSSGDTPEYIAQIILQAMVEGEAEYFAHERMKQLDK